MNDSATVRDFEEHQLGKEIVDAAFYVHTTFGPGLLESVYEVCLVEELRYRNLSVEVQKIVPLHFRDKKMDVGFRIDIFVENKVIIEVKACEKLLPIHDAQLLTYMKLTSISLGYVMNFNSPLIKDSIKRLVRRK